MSHEPAPQDDGAKQLVFEAADQLYKANNYARKPTATEVCRITGTSLPVACRELLNWMRHNNIAPDLNTPPIPRQLKNTHAPDSLKALWTVAIEHSRHPLLTRINQLEDERQAIDNILNETYQAIEKLELENQELRQQINTLSAELNDIQLAVSRNR